MPYAQDTTQQQLYTTLPEYGTITSITFQVFQFCVGYPL